MQRRNGGAFVTGLSGGLFYRHWWGLSRPAVTALVVGEKPEKAYTDLSPNALNKETLINLIMPGV